MIATFDDVRGGVPMASDWEQVVVDAEDPARLARWWAEALGYPIVHEEPDEVEIRRTPDTYPGLLFVTVPGAKSVKNRLHLDLRPDDQEAEVERLVDMGARPVDVGQGDVSWVVLADPEGNEFCVLASRRPPAVTGT
jgi:predicted enzyme related to lactoylglutathione lyase